MTPGSNFCHYDIQSTSSTRKKNDYVFDDDDFRDDDGSVNEKVGDDNDHVDVDDDYESSVMLTMYQFMAWRWWKNLGRVQCSSGGRPSLAANLLLAWNCGQCSGDIICGKNVQIPKVHICEKYLACRPLFVYVENHLRERQPSIFSVSVRTPEHKFDQSCNFEAVGGWTCERCLLRSTRLESLWSLPARMKKSSCIQLTTPKLVNLNTLSMIHITCTSTGLKVFAICSQSVEQLISVKGV